MSEDGESFLDGMSGIQSMGIINALRTGDPALDMVLAMALPFLLKLLFQLFTEMTEYLRSLGLWTQRQRAVYERIIVHKSTVNRWGSSNSTDGDSQNTILIKAIRLYLHKVVKLTLQDAEVDLTTLEDKQSSLGYRSYYDDDDDDDDSKTVVGALSKYDIVHKPRPNKFYKVGEYGKLNPATVSLIIEHNEEEKGGKESSHTCIIHQCRLQSASSEAVDEFVDKAYRWYMDELRSREDHARYLYELKSSTGKRTEDSDDGDQPSSGCVYTRYRLSDEKTFNSLFFQEKEGLLRLIEHFQKKTGKYAIEGYPHKLGILLHGPPGSGKTSLIKALAQYTKRSIVNVPLARIATNAELMSVFFDPRKYVEGEYLPVKLGFKDVIFVMEDIDAASKIVKRRDTTKLSDDTPIDPKTLPPSKCLWHMLLESNESDCKELVEKLIEKSETLKLDAQREDLMVAVANRFHAVPGVGLVGSTSNIPIVESICDEALQTTEQILDDHQTIDRYLVHHARVLLNMIKNGAEVSDKLVDELLGRSDHQFGAISLGRSSPSPDASGDQSELDELVKHPESTATEKVKSQEGAVQGPALPSTSLWMKPRQDQLNLQGLLNVLDGVVDSPRRIVIMTTNHIDHLDPALIRPGRIDKKMILGFMDAVHVMAMLEHYFQTKLSDEQKGRVEIALKKSPQMTPAQIEQLTAEHDTIDEMIVALEDR